MKVDNSSLTGESDALLRTPECTNKENPLETANLAFFGTSCKEGTARGVVIQIGDKTIIGQIANLAATASSTQSTLSIEVNRFIFVISIMAVIAGVFFFCMGFVIGYDAITNIVFGIGIIVANVPEGLLATVTASLSLAAKRLAAKTVLVKNLEAVETLGATTCICSDKTGTLTQNRMTVEHLWYDGKVFKGENYEKKGKTFEYEPESLGFQDLHLNCILCSEATFNKAPPIAQLENLMKIKNEAEREHKRKILEQEHLEKLKNTSVLARPTIGDASESALIKFFQPIRDIEITRENYPVRHLDDGSLAKIPFNSSWKFSLVICNVPTTNSDNCIFIKVINYT
jgi:ATPase, P-type (transporting), HAD superfamily, subfamily IC